MRSNRPRAILGSCVLALLVVLPRVCFPEGTPQRHLRLKNSTITWYTDWEPSRKQFVVLDAEGRRVVFDPENKPEVSGEMEFTWDALPATFSADQTAAIGFGGRISKKGTYTNGHGIDIFMGAGFDSDHGHRLGQYVGKASDGKYYEGRQQVRVSPKGLATLSPDTDATIAFGFGEVMIHYHYEVVSGPAPSDAPAKSVQGVWLWATGVTVTFRADGTFTTSDQRRGTWETVDRAGRGLRVSWEDGGDDFLVLAADGNSLEGKSRNGRVVAATRN